MNPDGWFTFKMGGMEHFTMPKGEVRLPEKFLAEPLPDYLSPEKVKQLYQLPVEFGDMTAEAGMTNAVLTIDLKKAGTNARAIVCYGERDYLTFAPRKRHGTERGSSVLDGDRAWPESVALGDVKPGKNTVEIPNLKPGTQYFYRVLIMNDEGKMWSFETHTFKTR